MVPAFVAREFRRMGREVGAGSFARGFFFPSLVGFALASVPPWSRSAWEAVHEFGALPWVQSEESGQGRLVLWIPRDTHALRLTTLHELALRGAGEGLSAIADGRLFS